MSVRVKMQSRLLEWARARSGIDDATWATRRIGVDAGESALDEFDYVGVGVNRQTEGWLVG